MYCGFAYGILIVADFATLMDLEKYAQTGKMSLLLTITNSPAAFIFYLGIPLLIIPNLRLWKKFE